MGAATTAKDFSLTADLSGVSKHAQVFSVPDGTPINLHLDDGSGGGAVILAKSLAEQAARQQIITGAEITGTLVYILKGVSKQQFEESKGTVKVSFADTSGNSYSMAPPDNPPTKSIPYIPGISISSKPTDKSLRWYYDNDFESGDRGVSVSSEAMVNDDVDKVNRPSYVRVFGDWSARAVFLKIFIPASYPTYRMCVFYSKGYKHQLDLVIHNPVKLRASPRHADSSQETRFEDLPFSGRIYIYHEAPLTSEQVNELIEMYKKNGLSLELRGPAYLALMNAGT